jgi:hypothetical protein
MTMLSGFQGVPSRLCCDCPEGCPESALHGVGTSRGSQTADPALGGVEKPADTKVEERSSSSSWFASSVRSGLKKPQSNRNCRKRLPDVNSLLRTFKARPFEETTPERIVALLPESPRYSTSLCLWSPTPISLPWNWKTTANLSPKPRPIHEDAHYVSAIQDSK